MTTYRTPLSQDYDWQLSVADRVAAPAGGEAKGTRYLITVGSGDFTGYDNYIATAKQASPTAPAHWYFDAPLEGMATYVKDEDKVYQYITSWLELRISCLFDVDRDTGIEVEQSADEDKIHFKTAGTERVIIDSTGLGIGLAVPTAKLHVQVANTINKQALLIEQLDTTNNPICAEINNDGTNHGLYIHQDGALGTPNFNNALFVYSNAVNTSTLVYLQQNNASSTGATLVVQNEGAGHGIAVLQNGVLAASKYSLYVYSNSAQVNSILALIWSDNASSSQTVLNVSNDGSGRGIHIDQNGNGTVLYADNAGTQDNVYILQSGNLATGKYVLYIDNNGTPVDGAGRCIRLDGCTVSGTGAILGYIGVNVDGTQRAMPYYAVA